MVGRACVETEGTRAGRKPETIAESHMPSQLPFVPHAVRILLLAMILASGSTFSPASSPKCEEGRRSSRAGKAVTRDTRAPPPRPPPNSRIYELS